jgi:hypothetical protein
MSSPFLVTDKPQKCHGVRLRPAVDLRVWLSTNHHPLKLATGNKRFPVWLVFDNQAKPCKVATLRFSEFKRFANGRDFCVG